MKKSYHLIANWKMNVHVHEAVSLAHALTILFHHNPSLITRLSLTLCPSFESLTSVFDVIKNSTISLGAQACSEHLAGNFSGEVSAYNLREIGCNYCIVGHSERRSYHHETKIQITKMCKNLFEQNIVPIFCIGESQKNQQEGTTFAVLEDQLSALFDAIDNTNSSLKCIIAYEPEWAVGGQSIPSANHLNMVLSFIKEQLEKKRLPLQWSMLYGGSVSEQFLPDLLKIELIEGFLIGRASTHLQQLESMIQHIRKLISS